MKCSKKCTIVILLLVIILNITSNAFAAINTNYDPGNEVQKADLNELVKSDDLINAIGKFIYAVASLIEYIAGLIFKGITGSGSFPWADRVIFNSIPMLDINFFNASEGSMFLSKEEPTTLSILVRNTYFTILAIAIAFLSIVIAITAIKLVISTLANQKAKYKEVLKQWLFAIVMLFLMHNLISFVFYTNEKMVEVASGILNGYLESGGLQLFNEINTLDYEKALSNFLTANQAIFDSMQTEKETINNNKEIAYKLLANSNYQESVLKKARQNAGGTGFVNGILQIWNQNGSQSVEALARDIDFINSGRLSRDDAGITYEINVEDLKIYLSSFDTMTQEQVAQHKVFKVYNSHVADLNLGKEQKRSKLYAKAIINVYNSCKENSTADENVSVISNVSEYLKEAAYVIPTDESGNITGWKRSEVTLQGALLYGIFVAQSLIYFVSYVKRFFYVITLAMMAPAIVLLDFLGKSLG